MIPAANLACWGLPRPDQPHVRLKPVLTHFLLAPAHHHQPLSVSGGAIRLVLPHTHDGAGADGKGGRMGAAGFGMIGRQS